MDGKRRYDVFHPQKKLRKNLTVNMIYVKVNISLGAGFFFILA
jgi:hypothetical protein